MIKITSVEIDGFITPKQRVKLDFVDSNIVCIYGNNGSGKTSFLEILFAIFDRDEKKLEEYNINSISIKYKKDTSQIEKDIEKLKFKEEQLNISLEKAYKVLEKIEQKEEQTKYSHQIIAPIEEDIDSCKHNIEDALKSIEEAFNVIYLEHSIDDEGKKVYDFENLEKSMLDNVSSLFLGIGRGIPKKELKIPRNMLWYFFNINREINEDKILTGNEIDDFTDNLVEYLMPKSKNDANNIEDYEVNDLDKKRNIYLQTIEIDTIEQLLVNKYKKSIVEADKKITQALAITSMEFFNKELLKKINIDIDILKKKLLKNKDLILEVFKSTKQYNQSFKDEIMLIIHNLESNDNYLNEIDNSNRIILFNIMEVLENEHKLFKQIQIFVDEYNKLLNYDKKIFINSEGVRVKPSNHLLKKLSSGEKHLLTFLATILLLGEEQNFILIDEPEISLNVDWQRMILSTIAKLAPNSQVIIATHSPLIARSYRKSVVGLEPKVIDDEE